MVTRRIGGLSFIQDSSVRLVIWSRSLTQQIKSELDDVPSDEMRPVDFVTLTADPHARVQHQLTRAGWHSRFLCFDVALLVSIFGDLSAARRVRVFLGDGNDHAWKRAARPEELRLMGVYPQKSTLRSRRRHLAGHVALFRGAAPSESAFLPSSRRLFLCMEKVPDSGRRIVERNLSGD